MPEPVSDWDAVYQYGASETGQTDGYWLFAPVCDGEVELFQLGTILAGDRAVSFSTAVVTSSAGVRHLRLPRNSDAEVVRDDDEFRVGLEQVFTLTRDAPNRAFRVQTTDPENDVRADLVVRPASAHAWPVKGYEYTTTHESDRRGHDHDRREVSRRVHLRRVRARGVPGPGGQW